MFIIFKIIQHHTSLKYRVIYWHVRTLALIFKSLITINDPANLPLKEPLDYGAINYLPLVNWLNVESFFVNFSFVVFKPFRLLSHLLKSIFSQEEAVLLLYIFSVFFFMSSIKLHASSVLMARNEILNLLVFAWTKFWNGMVCSGVGDSHIKATGMLVGKLKETMCVWLYPSPACCTCQYFSLHWICHKKM